MIMKMTEIQPNTTHNKEKRSSAEVARMRENQSTFGSISNALSHSKHFSVFHENIEKQYKLNSPASLWVR